VDQYELRELYYHSQMRTKEVEMQYHRKKLEQETTRSRQLNGQVTTFSKTERELRHQLNLYVEKFKQVGYAIFPSHAFRRSGPLIIMIRSKIH
jgi:hypothetical protein